MSATVVPVETNFVAQPTGALALAANPARAYLQIQNQSGGVVTYKFGGQFLVPTNAVQHVSFNRVPDGGTWTITFGPNTTTALAATADHAAIQTALEALVSIGAGNITVAGDYTAGFDLTFIGALAAMVQPLVVLGGVGLTDSTAASNAVQAINFSTPPTAGAFRLVFGVSTSDPLNFDITAAQLKTALNAMPSINGGVSAVTQDGTTKNFSVTFGNTPLASQALALLDITASTLTGSANLASQVVHIYAAPALAILSGSYSLSNGTDTTGPLDYNASAATIRAALEALPTIGVGNVTVTGHLDLTNGATITYQGALANTVVAPLYFASNTMRTELADPLASTDLVDIDDDTREVITGVNITTTGHGVDTVTTTFATMVAGGASAAVSKAVVTTVGGVAVTSDGVDIQVAAGALFDAEVPTSSVYMKSAGANANANVTIYEG